MHLLYTEGLRSWPHCCYHFRQQAPCYVVCWSTKTSLLSNESVILQEKLEHFLRHWNISVKFSVEAALEFGLAKMHDYFFQQNMNYLLSTRLKYKLTTCHIHLCIILTNSLFAHYNKVEVCRCLYARCSHYGHTSTSRMGRAHAA